MAQTNSRRVTPSPLLLTLIVVCVLLIVINTTNALQQSSSNTALSTRDIYTLETDTP